MIEIFIDTSAFYAIFDRRDKNNATASSIWKRIIEESFLLCTSNYIVVETLALLQSRLGFNAVCAFHNDIMGLVQVLWIDEQIHETAQQIHMSVHRRGLSFVDCSSFVLMRKKAIQKVFCFDRDFEHEGFAIASAMHGNNF